MLLPYWWTRDLQGGISWVAKFAGWGHSATPLIFTCTLSIASMSPNDATHTGGQGREEKKASPLQRLSLLQRVDPGNLIHSPSENIISQKRRENAAVDLPWSILKIKSFGRPSALYFVPSFQPFERFMVVMAILQSWTRSITFPPYKCCYWEVVWYFEQYWSV